MAYLVYIEMNGSSVPAGTISTAADGGEFTYDEHYLRRAGAAPISVHLPLQSETFPAKQTKVFFDGLLPEGFTRRTIQQRMHLGSDDYLKLLHALGRECLGAIRVLEEGEETDADAYEPLSMERVRELAAEGAEVSADLVAGTHVSLTGASGKVGLYHDAAEDRWYLPGGGAPSTHIVKQSHVRLEGIVTNEQLCLMTARRCGISTAEGFIINMGNAADGEVLLASARYDRDLETSKQYIGSLRRPLRLHQEDFAQAMGVSADEKYEEEKSGYLERMFSLLRRYSSNPVADQISLWDRIVFNYLLGNTDAHLKNYSLLYDAGLRSARLAPAYDLLSTTVYSSSTRNMSCYIGEECRIDAIDEGSFRMAAHEAGLGERMAMDHLARIRNCFPAALDESARELTALGFTRAEDIGRRIMETGGISH